jgi:phosphonate transport system substrate-binding protein
MYQLRHFIFLFILLPCISVNSVFAKEVLELWVHPYLSATEITRKFTPLVDYLNKQNDFLVELHISVSYSAHIKRIGEGRIGLAYLGPALYVKLTKQYGKQALLATLEINGQPMFHGMIVTRSDSAIHHIKDIAGKSFAFGSPGSTMSHILPQYMLSQNGISLKQLRVFKFLNSHQNVALGVLGGYYDAGAMKEEVFYKYQQRGLRMVATSPPVYEHLFIANKSLPKKTHLLIQQQLISLTDQKVLTSIKKTVTGLVVSADKNYDGLRKIFQTNNDFLNQP